MAETLADAAGARYVKLWIPGLSWIKGRNEKISVFFWVCAPWARSNGCKSRTCPDSGKCKVDKPQGLKYLGFGFYFDSRAYQFKAKPHAKSVAKFKKRMKELTCRSWGVSNSCKVEKLNQLIRGWINYFKIGSMKRLCKELDSRIRYRLRMCIWKQWKTPQNRIKNLMKLGVDKDTAWITAYTGSRIAYVCQRRVMNFAINKERLTKFGLVSMLDYYTERCVTC